MAKIRSLRHSDYLDTIVPPADCSYFEEMCWRAENEIDPENRGHAQYEVDRMVKANNDAAEEDRMKSEQSLADFLNDEVGSVFEGIHFQSNDDLTRMSVRSHLNGVMQGLLNNRHIADYKVVCDASNNPPYCVNKNELHVDVLYKDIRGNLFHAPYRKTGFSVPEQHLGSPKNSNLSKAIDIDVDVGTITIAGGGVGSSNGNILSSGNTLNGVGVTGANYSFSGSYITGVGLPGIEKISLTDSVSSNPDLPEVTFHSHDETGKAIKLHLRPESTIGAHEALKLAMLLSAAATNPSAFSVFLYVKKQNMERHFKFEY